jgi:hypothetical protein
MADNYNFNQQSFSTPNQEVTAETITARVMDIVLDSSHVDYETFGGPQSIGAIRYVVEGKLTSNVVIRSLPTAFPRNSNIKQYPLKGEIVQLHILPTEESSRSQGSKKVYYSEPIGIWNHPHHSSLPLPSSSELDLGKNFKEVSDVNPLLPFEGDFILEGRQGQSLRLSSTVKDNSKPIIIVSNGQVKTEEGFSHITEDINKDHSSLYFTSNQRIGLTPSYVLGECHEPKPTIDYTNSQLLGSSDRVHLNGRDSIILTSTNHINLGSEGVYVEGGVLTTIDAPRINLGSRANQQGVKGNELKELLQEILTELFEVGKMLEKAAIGKEPVVQANDAGLSLQSFTTTKLTELNQILSNKTYIE